MLPMIFLGGCGDDDATPDLVLAEPSTLKIGFFKDSAVEGIEYATETQSGVTSTSGAFNYQEDESVTFSIGDIVLPSAPAKFSMTPIDLVGGEENEESIIVTNISRLLQTLDFNNDPSDGSIEISQSAIDLASGVSLDFTDENFGEPGSVSLNYIDSLGRTDDDGDPIVMVSAVNARAHLSATVSEITAGLFTADFVSGNTFKVSHSSGSLSELYFNSDMTGSMTYPNDVIHQVSWDVNGNGELLITETEELVETNWKFSEASVDVDEGTVDYVFNQPDVVFTPGTGRMTLIENPFVTGFLEGNIFQLDHEDSDVTELNFLADGQGTITYLGDDPINITWQIALGILTIVEEGEGSITWVLTASSFSDVKANYSYVKSRDSNIIRSDVGSFELSI